jgi:hypothetical protein
MKKQPEGSVLFIVLIFIIAVTTLVLVSSIRSGSEAEFLELEFDRLRAYTRCISGMEYLKNRLSTGMNTNTEYLDGFDRPHVPRLMLDGRDIVLHYGDIIKGKYARRVSMLRDPGMEFTINLQDSAGLVPFLRMDRNLLKNLFAYYEIPADRADTVIDSLYDWMDPDDFVRANGAESPYYLKTHGYTAANRLLDAREEMLLVKGVDKEIYNKIGGLLDFSAGNRGVNPNTMPGEVFYLFRGVSDQHIRRIFAKREQQPIEGPAALTLAAGFNFTAYPNALQFFTSNTTYVKIKSKMNENHYFYLEFRLDRIAGAGGMRQAREASPFSRKQRYDTFSDYYNTFNIHEGTGVIHDQQQPTSTKER